MKNISILIFICSFIYSSHLYAENHRLYNLLAAKQYGQLEQETQAIQKQFETGTISEFDLKDAFDDFNHINETGFSWVVEWEKRFPQSYAAHLAKGIYYRKESITPSDTNKPQPERQPADVIKTIAIDELKSSLALTTKPYLSLYYLVDIVKPEDQALADKLLKQAVDLFPKCILVRNQYMQYLSPRFGGSFELMAAFIEQSQRDGSAGYGLQQLEAIYEDEQGSIDQQEKHRMMSINHYGVALAISQGWGSDFRRDFIPHADKAACKEPELRKFCK